VQSFHSCSFLGIIKAGDPQGDVLGWIFPYFDDCLIFLSIYMLSTGVLW
jgi:hypothetical protein